MKRFEHHISEGERFHNRIIMAYDILQNGKDFEVYYKCSWINWSELSKTMSKERVLNYCFMSQIDFKIV